jgi:hypothetical protein
MSVASPISTSASAPIVWPVWARVAVSVAVVWHLVGVMVAPLSTPPRFEGQDSVIGSQLKTIYEPYVTALYLNHAYKFFAPNPGDSHLLRYDLYFADGTKRVNRDDQILPDRFHHWPRLLYHRHFMLTEFINDFAPPWVWRNVANDQPSAGAAAGASPSPVQGEVLPPAAGQGGPPHVKVYVDGIAAYLARRYGASRVDLFYRKHLLPSVDDFREVGKRLDSPESYLDRLITSYTPEKRP